jgi:hypothetical protein
MDRQDYYVYMYLREDGTPYYVGKGKEKRAYSNNRNINKPSENRIVFPYTNLTEEQAFQKEMELIAQYGRKDNGTGILRNRTDGGEGSSGRIWKMPPESVEKVRLSKLGKKQSPEHIEKIRQKNKGKKRSKEFCERMSILQKNRTFSPEHREKLSKAHLGKTRSSEHRENIGRVQRGKKLSPETIERMRIAAKERWIKRKQSNQSNPFANRT